MRWHARLILIAAAILLSGQSPGPGSGATMRRPGKGVPSASAGATLLFDFDPSDSNQIPSVDRLNATLTVNSLSETPAVRYKGPDATATAWNAWTYGPNLGIGGTGTAPSPNKGSPLMQANDDSVKYEGGEAHQDSGNTGGDITTEDFAIEIVFRAADAADAVPRLFGKHDGTNGWDIKLESNGTLLRASLDDGDACQPDAASGDITVDAWHHVIAFFDRDEASTNGSRWYINAVSSGPGDDITLCSSTLTNTTGFTIGARSDHNSLTQSESHVAYVAMWKRSAWFQGGAGNLTDWAAVAQERFERLTGVWAVTGGAVLAARSRGSTAYLRKYQPENDATTLYQVGKNWPRVEYILDQSITPTPHYVLTVEASAQNINIYSDDLTQGSEYTLLDAGDTWDTSGNDDIVHGEDNADCLIADTTDGAHGVTFDATVIDFEYHFCVFIEPGGSDSQGQLWTYLSNDSDVNINAYFNHTECGADKAIGTVGSGVTGTSTEWFGSEDGDAGWCRFCMQFDTNASATHTFRIGVAEADGDASFAGDGATINQCITGVMLASQLNAHSYVRTNGSAVTRSGDSVSATLPSSVSQGTVLADLMITPGDGLAFTLASGFDINTGTDKVDVEHTGTDISVVFEDGGVGQADISITQAVEDGALRSIGASWGPNLFDAALDGTFGTQDTSGTAPDVQTLKLDAQSSYAQIRVWSSRDESLLDDNLLLKSHRTSGTAPLAVYFDCTANAKEWRDGSTTFAWDFGDGAAGSWSYGVDLGSQNTDTHPFAVHVYATPGTYTAKCTLSTGATKTVSITATDPDDDFPTTATECVSTSGTFTDCPAGATQTTSSDWDAVISGQAADTRLLFRGGETFTSSARVNLTVSNLYLGSFGTGKANIVCAHTDDLLATSSTTQHVDNWIVTGWNITETAACDSFLETDGRQQRILAWDNTIDGVTLFETGVSVIDANNNPENVGLFAVNNTVTNGGSYQTYISASKWLGIVGNSLTGNDAGHNLRVVYGRNVVIAHNFFDGPSGTGHMIKLHAASTDLSAGPGAADRRSEYIVIQDNEANTYSTASGSDTDINDWDFSLAPQSATWDEDVHQYIVSDNTFVFSTDNTTMIQISGQHGSMDNNRFAVTDKGGAGERVIDIYQRGVEPEPTDNTYTGNVCEDDVSTVACVINDEDNP